MYIPDKVITVGGGGAMAFVDLCNYIIICDVLDERPELDYLPLPPAYLHPCRRRSINYSSEPRDLTTDVTGDPIHI